MVVKSVTAAKCCLQPSFFPGFSECAENQYKYSSGKTIMAHVITEVGLIFFASMVFMLLALRLRLPPVVGLLLAGAIIGPNMLGLVAQSEYIAIFSEIGAILLLFFVGIEFSIGKMASMGLRSFVVWLLKDTLIFIFVYEISLIFGLGEVTSLVLASALAISSTTFFIKLVGEKNLSGGQEANLVFIVLIIEDLLAIFLLAIYSGMAAGGVSDMSGVLLSILKAMLVLTVTYMVLQKIVHAMFARLSEYKSDEIMVFLSLGFAIMLSFFASAIGLAPSIGAFLAGNILSSVKGFGKTQDTLSKFGMLFSSFFFLSIGMTVSPDAMAQNILIIAVLFLTVAGGAFVSVYVSSYLMGYRSGASTLSGLLVLAVGEFSLLIAMETRELVAPFDIVSVTSALVFLTALGGGILIQYNKGLDSLISGLVPHRIKDSAKRISLYLNEVFREFEPGGGVYVTFSKEGARSVISVILTGLVAVSAVLAYNIMQHVFPEYSNYVIAAAVVLGAIPFLNIIYSVKKLLDSAAQAFHKAMGENLTLDDVAMRNSAIVFFLFAVAMIMPLAVAFLNLPSIFGLAFVIPLGVCILFVWNLASTIRRIMFKKEMHHYEKKRAAFKAPYGRMLGEIKSINEPVYRGRGK